MNTVNKTHILIHDKRQLTVVMTWFPVEEAWKMTLHRRNATEGTDWLNSEQMVAWYKVFRTLSGYRLATPKEHLKYYSGVIPTYQSRYAC